MSSKFVPRYGIPSYPDDLCCYQCRMIINGRCAVCGAGDKEYYMYSPMTMEHNLVKEVKRLRKKVNRLLRKYKP